MQGCGTSLGTGLSESEAQPTYPVARKSSASRLVTLCYHRIGAPDPGRFYGYRPNFSATTEQFRAQMQLLKSLFTPISALQLAGFLDGAPLPDRPALVTFDDGYRDNGLVAWPILREMGIPAIVFLATGHIGTNKPFLWDFAAFCFERTHLDRAIVPLLGEVQLGDQLHRRQIGRAHV